MLRLLSCLIFSLLQLSRASPSRSPPSPHASSSTNATYFNSASTPGADPYTFFDFKSGLYWTFSTEGQDPGFLFAIYSSPDLVSWSKVEGGAMKACQNVGQENETGEMCWAKDWQWAPEVYHNERTGFYFLFFAGRLREDLAADWFRYRGFEEPSKLGVAVSRSPSGPFKEINSQPIDYLPFDPDYHDVNLIMDEKQMKPPATESEGQLAPKGIYIPSIDPNIYFSEDGKIYLYFSRNAYRNWIWDSRLKKYIEESNILGVELKRDWWDDPLAKTMPSIIDSEKDRYSKAASPLPSNISSYNGTGPEIKEPKRKDGWKTLISYKSAPQDWEDFHVDDYSKFNGTKKDRRWSEGSTLISRNSKSNDRYLMTYSCNNYEASRYGVGYATSSSPLGPFKKSTDNPVLTQSPDSEPAAFSVGHGSIVTTFSEKEKITFKNSQLVQNETPNSSELFYIHHGRNSTDSNRSLYTTRISLSLNGLQELKLRMDLGTRDQLIPNGTSPYRLEIKSESPQCVNLCKQSSFEADVYSSSGARFDLEYPHHRLWARVEPESSGTADVEVGTGKVDVTLNEGKARNGKIIVGYQRQSVDGSWKSIEQSGKLVQVERKLCHC